MEKRVTVKAKPDGTWTFVDVLWSAPLRLQFAAAAGQKWNYSASGQCTADGDPQSLIDPARTILGSGPVGAIIGKIGGSSAGASDGAATFLVGSRCAFETKADWRGILYLTINDEPRGMGNNSGEIEVVIDIDVV